MQNAMAGGGCEFSGLVALSEPSKDDVVVGYQPSIIEALDQQESTNSFFLRLIFRHLPAFQQALESLQPNLLSELVQVLFDLVVSNGRRFVQAQICPPGIRVLAIWYDVSRQDAKNFIWQEVQRVWHWSKILPVTAAGASQGDVFNRQVAAAVLALTNPPIRATTSTLVTTSSCISTTQPLHSASVSLQLQRILQQQQQAESSQRQQEASQQQLTNVLFDIIGSATALAGPSPYPIEESSSFIDRASEENQEHKNVPSNMARKLSKKTKKAGLKSSVQHSATLTSTVPIRQVSINSEDVPKRCGVIDCKTLESSPMAHPRTCESSEKKGGAKKSKKRKKSGSGHKTNKKQARTDRAAPTKASQEADALLLLSCVASGLDDSNA